MSSPARLRPQFVAVGVLVILTLAWFAPWWVGGKVLAPLDILNQFIPPWSDPAALKTVHNHFPSDAVTQYLPYRMFAEKSYREDGEIGWNNLLNGGQPQYANTMGLYFDWTMQLHRWFDFWTAWHLGLIGQFLLAGVGMWWFLQGRGFQPTTCLAGGIAYMGNFQFIAWIYHRWALSSFCWMPWVLWAVLRWREKRGRSWVWIPIFLALAFLGGSLQHAAFVVIVMGCLWVAEIFEKKSHSCLRITGGYLLWGMLALGLAAMMFLPCVQAFLVSRSLGETRGGLGYADGLLQPVFNLLSYPFIAFPSLLGGPQTIDLWKAFKTDLFYLPWFGVVPTLLAFTALFRPKIVSLPARLLVLAGLLIPLTPLVGPLYPRVFLVFILGGVWAFAEIWECPATASGSWARRFFWLFAGLCLVWLLGSVAIQIKHDLLLGWVRGKIATMESSGQFGMFHDWMDDRVRHFVDSLIIWAPDQWPFVVLALAGLGLWWGKTNGRFASGVAGGALSLVLALEISLFATRWVTWSDLKITPAYAHTPEIIALQQTVGGGRLALPNGAPPERAFPPNTLQPLNVAILGGYESILPPSLGRPLVGETPADTLSRAGVTHAATLPDSPFATHLGWRLLWKSARLAIWSNPTAHPKYQLQSGEVSTVSADVTIFQETQNRRLLGLPPGHWTLHIAENYSEGWQLQQDGGPWIAVSKALDGSMTIPLPPAPARATIALRYHPAIRIWGLRLSLLSLLVLMLAAFLFPKKSALISQ